MNTSWATAFDTSTGALIEAAFKPLHGFGKFCAVVVALGLISNSVPGTYCRLNMCTLAPVLAGDADLLVSSGYNVCSGPRSSFPSNPPMDLGMLFYHHTAGIGSGRQE